MAHRFTHQENQTLAFVHVEVLPRQLRMKEQQRQLCKVSKDQPSVLAGYLDSIKGAPADYMHCVLEGVVGSLLKMWTDSRFHSQPFLIVVI